MNPVRLQNAAKQSDSPFDWPSIAEREVLDEKSFKRMIAIERKRTERTNEPFLLMLLDAGNRQHSQVSAAALDGMASALAVHSRETDVVGWYKDQTAVGVLFTGLEVNERNAVVSAILNRMKVMLRDELVFNQFNQVSISFHFYPDDWDDTDSGQPGNPTLYPDLFLVGSKRRSRLFIKRVIDVAGSALALFMCLPLFLAIAVAIKMSSKGPVFFKQTRVGQYGQSFTFLKFRSMYVNNDHEVHRKYVTELISRKAEGEPPQPGETVYKLTDDKRITKVGKFLRMSSLDELPQFINVLRGDMSLVGPRPAIPYELAAYQTWHRRRVLEARPGITGLWQVEGRSRVTFDDMVRMDLRYANNWSLWLDLKILMRTPFAVVKGAGAY